MLYYYIGYSYALSGHYLKAFTNFNFAIGLNPQDSDCYLLAAFC